MSIRRWKALRWLPLGLLAVVLVREKPWAVQLSAHAPWAIAATILLNFAVSLPLKAARWRIALPDPPPFRAALAATIEGLLATVAIGFGSGDVVRAARLGSPNRDLAVDYACTLAERGAEVLALAILIFVTALLTKLGTLALALSGLVVVAYAALLGAGRLLVPRFSAWPRLQRVLSAALQASTPRRVATITALSLLGWATEAGMLVLFQGAFHLETSFRTAIPTLPGNFGTFEAGATVALVMSGAPRDTAVSYALIYHLTHVIPVAVVATILFVARYGERR
jgi:glycosyltransferase AglD